MPPVGRKTLLIGSAAVLAVLAGTAIPVDADASVPAPTCDSALLDAGSSDQAPPSWSAPLSWSPIESGSSVLSWSPVPSGSSVPSESPTTCDSAQDPDPVG